MENSYSSVCIYNGEREKTRFKQRRLVKAFLDVDSIVSRRKSCFSLGPSSSLCSGGR